MLLALNIWPMIKKISPRPGSRIEPSAVVRKILRVMIQDPKVLGEYSNDLAV
jgi:hypothetical protein